MESEKHIVSLPPSASSRYDYYRKVQLFITLDKMDYSMTSTIVLHLYGEGTIPVKLDVGISKASTRSTSPFVKLHATDSIA